MTHGDRKTEKNGLCSGAITFSSFFFIAMRYSVSHTCFLTRLTTILVKCLNGREFRNSERICVRAWVGGKHVWVRGPSLPAKKSAFAFLQKIFGLNLRPASKTLRHGASSLPRGSPPAPQ